MVYDCFTFFNELDILEIRLNILDKVVDKFVLVEATRTHQGKEKPLYFEQNKDRYKDFLDKIIHVVIDEYPPYEGQSAWILERYQRNMIMKGLKECKPEDIVLVSDVDEIPKPEIITQYKDKSGIKIFRQKMYYYFFNCYNESNGDDYRWVGTVMTSYKKMRQPQDMRTLSIRFAATYSNRFKARIYWKLRLFLWQIIHFEKLVAVDDGGWHFSYLGGVEMIVKKLEAFAHSEYNKAEYKDPAKIEQALKEGKDIFGRGFKYRFVSLDASFPAYIIKNKEKYKQHIREDQSAM